MFWHIKLENHVAIEISNELFLLIIDLSSWGQNFSIKLHISSMFLNDL